MTEFFIFMYAMLAMFVIVTVQKNNREARPTPQVTTMVGWGLFSLSSTLAMLLAVVAVALALGVQMPISPVLEASLF